MKTTHALIGDRLKHVVDSYLEIKKTVTIISPAIQFVSSLETILYDVSVKGVIIVTPSETHFTIAKQCIVQGKHIPIEITR
ncbi:MAG: Gfo/Idh/MocA family oxidoreductase [Bacteroidota bacterium]